MKIKLSSNRPPKVEGKVNARPIQLMGAKIRARPKTYLSSGAIPTKGPKYKLSYKSPIKISKRR